MILSFCTPLALLSGFAFLVLSSTRLLNRDKVRWKGMPNGPTVNSWTKAPILEERLTQDFRFLNFATKREVL
jgi:hypothetical protein